MRLRRNFPGGKAWYLSLFGGKNTYPVTIEFNLHHFGQKVYHGPFYNRPKHLSILQVDNAEQHWGHKLFPLVWGSGGWLHCVERPEISVSRIWFYSRWGVIMHIDITINRKPRA
jgi:hypothetical protein